MKTPHDNGIVHSGISLLALLAAVGCGQAGDGFRADTADPDGARFER
jgi:hypothetical protein